MKIEQQQNSKDQETRYKNCKRTPSNSVQRKMWKECSCNIVTHPVSGITDANESLTFVTLLYQWQYPWCSQCVWLGLESITQSPKLCQIHPKTCCGNGRGQTWYGTIPSYSVGDFVSWEHPLTKAGNKPQNKHSSRVELFEITNVKLTDVENVYRIRNLVVQTEKTDVNYLKPFHLVPLNINIERHWWILSRPDSWTQHPTHIGGVLDEREPLSIKDVEDSMTTV